MWTKTLTVVFKKQKFQVQIWLSISESTSGSEEAVCVQSMANEYFLFEEIKFTNRDSAHDFIKHYPLTMAKAFLIRTGYSEGAFN